MKKILRACFLLVLMVTSGGLLKAQQPFITRWNLAGTTTLSFGTATSGTVNYTWKEVSPGTASGSGSFSGNTLTINGLPSTAIDLSIFPTNFRRIIIGNNQPTSHRLLDVKQWGTTAWTSMRDAFFGCSNLNITATDIPNLSATNMEMGQMFQLCSSLTTVPNINSWNTSSVIYMTSMFNGAKLFNQNIGSWNTANVIGMVRMFTNANSFNQDISGWNTAKVGSMISMFELATSFNQNIGNWNTGAVKDMTKMFQNATSFNQNLGNWKLNASVDMRNMLDNCGMDCSNYSATLVGWNANPSTPNGRTLGATGRTYGPQATAARTNLTGTKGWTITGDGSSIICGISSAPSERLRTELVGEGSKVDENVYPNPFVGRVTIEADLKDVTEKDIKLVDLLGREFRPLSTRKISVTRMELDLSNLVTGQYFIKINSKSGTKVFKVMRQ
jgi:surface protein